jgi:hypothetical protein
MYDNMQELEAGIVAKHGIGSASCMTIMKGSRGNNSAAMEPLWPLCAKHTSVMHVQCGS